jgi:hypothetical protein
MRYATLLLLIAVTLLAGCQGPREGGRAWYRKTEVVRPVGEGESPSQAAAQARQILDRETAEPPSVDAPATQPKTRTSQTTLEDKPHVRVTRHELSVHQPDEATEAASFSFDLEGDKSEVSASTGSVQGVDRVMMTVTDNATWFGIALIAAGIGLIVLRFALPSALPFIPLVLPVALLAAGGAMFFLPPIIDRYAGVVFWVGLGFAGFIVILAGVQIFSDIDLLNRDPKTKKRIKKEASDG